MDILIGLIIIAVGAFLNSSCYVPINKIRHWSWETYWLFQALFAFLIFPAFGASLAVPSGESLFALYAANPEATTSTFIMGVIWGIGGLTFGLSLRYLGVALGLSLSQGICAALGVLIPPFIKPIFVENAAFEPLTSALITGVVVTAIAIAIIGMAGAMRSANLPDEEKLKGVKDLNFGKGIFVALLCGATSACFSIGLEIGGILNFGDRTHDMFKTLPATFLITSGGLIINIIYCLCQNARNKTFGDYLQGSLYVRNVLLCMLAGALWYSQFFGLSLGKGFLTGSDVLMKFSWCILLSMNILWSNVWGIVLKEWRGAGKLAVLTLLCGLIVLVVSIFLPQLLA